VTPHYCANITGHGWRKLLRHPGRFSYRIHSVPEVPPVLGFIQRHAHLDDREAYSTLNMGAGFALFVAAGDAQRTVDIAQGLGIGARIAGKVHAGAKELLIEPLGLRFDDSALQLR
jgi:phosphoribosylformylglycinamidine cyclo-ligase